MAAFAAGILNASSWTSCGAYKHSSLSQCHIKFTPPFDEHAPNKCMFCLKIASSWLPTTVQSDIDLPNFRREMLRPSLGYFVH
jgi:hypothetical protein